MDDDLESYLPRFGLSSFRKGQHEVISAVMADEDCLCIMPTGGGKSLCYQLPAIARSGLTLVISPLIALMKDQVDALTRLGLRAAFINSTLTPGEQQQRLDQMAAGEFDLVYVVPERFRSPRFLDAVRGTQLRLLAVDEAHCVSEWGHDFRPDYARLGQFRRRLGSPPTIALTATATQVVRQDIVELLELRTPRTFVTGFERPNLHYEVNPLPSDRAKTDRLLAFLARTPGTGIVYASSRKRCEEIVETITSRTKRKARLYHAGLATDDRRAAQDAFMSGQAEIIVATNAFGMGIDKADVRFVIHYNMPGTIEAYYQEAGRAGRDGQPAHCLLLYSPSDRQIQEFFIENACPSRQVVEQVYQLLSRLNQDPIEITQEEVKDMLGLDVSPDAIGRCEQLLAKANVLERLESGENMALVGIKSDLPTLVDLLPPQARVQRKVLRGVEKLLGERRHELVPFNRRDLLNLTELDADAVTRALAGLRELEVFEYVPPFRGRAIRMLKRNLPIAELGVDFDWLDRRRQAEYDKLDAVSRFAESADCRQQSILAYFGESEATNCGHCDNCAPLSADDDTPDTLDDGAREAVLKVLSGVARAQGRFGRNLVAQMLCGSKAEMLTRCRLDKLSTYAALAQLRQAEVVEMIDALLAVGYIRQSMSSGSRPLVQLTEAGERVMRGQSPITGRLVLPHDVLAKVRRSAGKRRPDSRPTPAQTPARVVSPPVASSSAPLASKHVALPPALASKVDGTNSRPEIEPPPAATSQTIRRDGAHVTRIAASSNLAASAPAPESRPSYYWTWNLLHKGFTPAECAAIRSLPIEEVLDHALRAADEGLAVSMEWLLEPWQIMALRTLIGDEMPQLLQPLVTQLPSGATLRHLKWYLKCRQTQ